MERLRIQRRMSLDGNATIRETDIFVHGSELWRLQKTISGNNTPTKTETIDFTENEFKHFFPALYTKARRQLDKQGRKDRASLEYVHPYVEQMTDIKEPEA